MQQEEYIDKGVKYVRIDKRKARIKFGKGKTIYLIPDRMRLENAWHSLYAISKNWIKSDQEFDNYVNNYMYYNYDSKGGRTVKYFIKQEDYI